MAKNCGTVVHWDQEQPWHHEKKHPGQQRVIQVPHPALDTPTC